MITRALKEPASPAPFPYLLVALIAHTVDCHRGPWGNTTGLFQKVISDALEQGTIAPLREQPSSWEDLLQVALAPAPPASFAEGISYVFQDSVRQSRTGNGPLLQLLQRQLSDFQLGASDESSIASFVRPPLTPQQVAVQYASEATVIVRYLASTTVAWSLKVSLVAHFLRVRLGPWPTRDHRRIQGILYANLLEAAEGHEWQQLRCALLPCLFADLSEAATRNDDGTFHGAVLDALRAVKRSQTLSVAPIARACEDLLLIKASFAAEFYPEGEERPPSLVGELGAEAQRRGMEVGDLLAHHTFAADAQEGAHSIFSRLDSSDNPSDWPAARQVAFALNVALQEAVNGANASLPTLSSLCGSLLDCPRALQRILLFTPAADLVAPLRPLLDDEDDALTRLCGLGDVDDEPAMLNRVLLFVQTVQQQQQRRADHATILTDADPALVSRWIKELFDSDGVSDELIKDSSPPRVLLALVPTLFSQAITAAELGVIDAEMLKSGLSVFLQDVLSFALPPGLRWLMEELAAAEAASPRRELLAAALGVLLLDDSCPRAAVRLVEPTWRSAVDKMDRRGSGAIARAAESVAVTTTVEALRVKFREVEERTQKDASAPLLDFDHVPQNIDKHAMLLRDAVAPLLDTLATTAEHQHLLCAALYAHFHRYLSEDGSVASIFERLLLFALGLVPTATTANISLDATFTLLGSVLAHIILEAPTKLPAKEGAGLADLIALLAHRLSLRGEAAHASTSALLTALVGGMRDVTSGAGKGEGSEGRAAMAAFEAQLVDAERALREATAEAQPASS